MKRRGEIPPFTGEASDRGLAGPNHSVGTSPTYMKLVLGVAMYLNPILDWEWWDTEASVAISVSANGWPEAAIGQ